MAAPSRERTAIFVSLCEKYMARPVGHALRGRLAPCDQAVRVARHEQVATARRPRRFRPRLHPRRRTEIARGRSEEHTSELQSLMRNSYAVFSLKKKNKIQHNRQR